MLLPENKRREKTIDLNPDMWIYADSYVGNPPLLTSLMICYLLTQTETPITLRHQ